MVVSSKYQSTGYVSNTGVSLTLKYLSNILKQVDFSERYIFGQIFIKDMNIYCVLG